MELWDIYDSNKQKTGKTKVRGDFLSNDEFHLVANAWIKNDKGEFLISQRVPTKTHGLLWECTGGSAIAGEDSLQAAIREAKEELSVNLDANTAVKIGSTLRYYKGNPDILDVWIFKCNTPIEEITIQKEEVNDVKWATRDEILEMCQNKQFLISAFCFEALYSKM
ncbi:MAG: NUDIX domain-containing protein [Clostridia bacterium]|nr:NUDIX domain-containing protein [Clostridia bacterium]